MPGGFEKINEYNQKLSPDERKASAKKAGKASGQARKKKKELKEYLQALLDTKQTAVVNGKVKKVTTSEAMAMKAIQGALNGDWKAWELVRDTAGQKPVDKVKVTTIDQDIIDEVERAVEAESGQVEST